MKLAAVCCTYRRPVGLGQLIDSFLRQDYPESDRELIILDDAGQYANQEGRGWRLVSIPQRFATLGDKRNACAALASRKVEGFLVADDDDIYLPHWFSTQAKALSQSEWSRPSLVYLSNDLGPFQEHDTDGLYHGGWAYRRDLFYRVRGYGPINNGEDQDLGGRFAAAGATVFDPSSIADPFYVYVNNNGSYHLSHLGQDGYERLTPATSEKSELNIGWAKDWTKHSVRRRYVVADKEQSPDGLPLVQLVGPVLFPGGDGPSNGMSALQDALRKRVAGGCSWLKIRSLPVIDGALAWFWNWNDRRYANWWNSTERPFVVGPNVLFMDSRNPRCDKLEAGILDAGNCKAFFCHTDWYRDLIAKHKGPENKAVIETWPYPIEPKPSGPATAAYDVLIYAKNGYRPGLLEFLAENFKSHIQIHYGQYRREQLWEAASKSRVCAYLADDDHGPLALQEILLSGCPVVGVPTGAPYITDGVTGVRVERMPPAPQFANRDDDSECLSRYLSALGLGMTLDRETVRGFASQQFDTEAIADRVISLLQGIRASL